jgi:hypothetical protein
MKRILALALATLLVSSCGLHAPPEWEGTANPLDTPSAELTVPESEGDFGHGWTNR